MVMMVMMMVMVMVMVPKALRQVGWLHQRQCQSINILKAFDWPSVPKRPGLHSASLR
jgi:hypothetical protein